MKNLFSDKSGFSPSQLKIADFIERYPEEMLFMTEQEIADRLGTSIATVSRFWRAVGYENAKAFKLKLRETSDKTPAVKLEKTISEMDASSLPVKMLEQAVHHLQETSKKTDPDDLEQAARLMASARRVYVYAPGPSLSLGELLSYRLSRFGMSIRLMAGSGHELLESLAHLEQDDVVLIFSFTRMLPETEVILDCVSRVRNAAIMITDREDFRYGTPAQLSFFVSRGDMGEFHSMVTPLLLVEQLILSIGMLNKEQVLKKLDDLGKLRTRYADKLPRGKA
ncbi:transcriptional regulator, RpiR family protein [Paenibacillus vortex V453]|uniref:RpiR family transcriptional regulator n=2 Tax=Paenibacillus TaxID=44249 RepID=A0A163JD56_9BACL|nr:MULTISPECIES: MurR/RpiR family transcriptional regulator [Paenibacillus]ANA80491.1 RpiR family transcriptional regulator [Paenibacillus glucanolyticus]AVV55439.1 MurR/RpiR family transcriptional regulator [Paenibacillus glucanolyticus]AWP30025.1 MurR/RpiR family transcriptional regulator [Paenibacillus sp. Cedars]EFU43234.1 transcriptional regulator, RpiR family protein [Paenibacillus vortex V453]ETT43654.1 RpiR family transcriptional regulator [Paenibacillus sp. FSL R5-808]